MQKASSNLIKDLKKQKREKSSLLFLDNYKIIKDAIGQGLKPLLMLVCDDSQFEIDCPIYKAERFQIEQLADNITPQNVLCVLEYTQHIVEKPKNNFLVLDGLQDPGNVGTLIRTAKACGFDSVFLVDSVKPTNPKLVRSTVGTLFTSKVYSMTKKEFIDFAKKEGLQLLVADMNGKNIFDFIANQNIGVVLGNEGQGVSQELRNICTETIKIPMKDGVESLNVAVSGAIIMYQMAKNTF